MLPDDLAKLKYLKRVNDNEYSAACPKCGGEAHKWGGLPDRFRIWLKSRATGGLVGWCRKCGYVYTPKGEKMPQNSSQWHTEQEQERRTIMEQAILLLQQERAWERYHDNLNGTYREYYYMRGLTDFWIDYWTLGYNPEKSIWTERGEHLTPTLTIPLFLPGQENPINIRNRLLVPPSIGDKYRPEFKNLPSALFYTDKDNKPKGKALVVEGEFKAMITYVTLDDPNIFVVGTPGKTPNAELFSLLDDCEAVYILFDPDAYEKQGKERKTPIRRLLEIFKERARILRLPMKVDDMITDGYLDKDTLKRMLYDARRLR